MRRALATLFCLGTVVVGMVASCSSFSEDESTEDGGDDSAAIGEDAPLDTGSDALAPVPCPEPLPAVPCVSDCVGVLPAPPPSALQPGHFGGARVAVRRGAVYVARLVDAVAVELFAFDSEHGSWSLRGSYPASSLSGLGANDATILLSLSTASGVGDQQQAVEIDASCLANCPGKSTPILMSRSGNARVLTVGDDFYFTSDTSILTLQGGVVSPLGDELGGPVIATDCSYLYYSSSLDSNVHRLEPTTRIVSVTGTDVGIFDASGFDGPFPGTFDLAVSDAGVFATVGSGQVYTMPREGPHEGHAIVRDGGGGPIVADDRYVYYGEVSGTFLYSMVRMLPDGGNRAVLTSPSVFTDITSDGAYVYVVDANGQVTRIQK